MSTLRHRLARRASLTAVAAGTTAVLGLVVATGVTMANATNRVSDLGYVLTGAANAHREVQKMEVASRGDDASDMDEMRRRRAFVTQQLRLSIPGLTEREDPNTVVPVMLRDLAHLDVLMAENGEQPPTADIAAAITEVEVSLKRIYDVEEFRFLGLNNAVIAAKGRSERLLLLLAAVIATSGVALLLVLRRNARHNLGQKATELASALADLQVVQAERRELLDETVRAGERERTRLAAELHDGPIQSLAAVCFRLDRAESKFARGDNDGAALLVTSARSDLGDEVAELRRLMSELRPPALDEDGLAGATRDYVDAFGRQTGIVSTATIELFDEALSPEREVVVYRLIQEALTNVRRHARADNVTVTIRGLADEVELCVVDDGVGFDIAGMSGFVRENHYGLAGMRERVEQAGGTFTVESAPARGVSLRAWLPGRRGAEEDQSAA